MDMSRLRWPLHTVEQILDYCDMYIGMHIFCFDVIIVVVFNVGLWN